LTNHGNKRLFLAVILASITILLMIILLVTLDDKNEVALEIFSLVIYLIIAYFLFKFYEEYSKNKELMKNQIYVYSYKLMPMLHFVSTGNGSQGTMEEHNKEYIYFCIFSSQFVFWTLIAGLLLRDESKYIGFSLSALAFIIIYIYIQTRVQKGKSFKYVDLSLIQKNHFIELQTQALKSRIANTR
jgi:hypothetical protein